MSKRWVFWIAVVAVFGLVVAACGDDDAADGDDVETADDAPADDDAPSDDAPADDDTDPDDTTSTTEPEEEIVLTDSFRGVTSEKILLGHSAIDFDKLNNDFGLDLAFQDFRPQVDAIVAWYNENGGVLGRELEVVHELYLPVGPTTAEAACLKLTEDVEVFAVLNGFSGPGAESVNECITDLHDTILVAGTAPRADQAEQAGGIWVAPDMSLDRRNAALAKLLADAGVLDELGPMMVVGSNPDEEPLVKGMAEALRDQGVDVPVEAWITTTGDETATQGEVTTFINRARSDGVSTVVMLGAGEFRNQAFHRQAPDFTYVYGNGDQISDWESIPPEGLQDGTRVITNNNGRAEADDPLVQECIDVVEAAQGVEVIPAYELPEGDPNYYSGTIGACRRVGMFVQIAEAAGPDLTNESWVAALDNVPDLQVPGYEFSSLSSSKVDARDQLVLVEYDLATLTFNPISEPINVG